MRLQTWEPTFRQLVYSPETVFQNLIVRSAVPPPETKSPCWWGDHANAFTAALCFIKLKTGAVECMFHRLRRLSFPPEASCCWPKDHLRPQTSCLCPTILMTKSSFFLISLTRMFLSRDPLAKIWFEFHETEPTRAPCPSNVDTFLLLIASHNWTSPECVPTARMFEVWLQDVLVTKSFEFSYSNRITLALFAFHK